MSKITLTLSDVDIRRIQEAMRYYSHTMSLQSKKEGEGCHRLLENLLAIHPASAVPVAPASPPKASRSKTSP